MKRLKRGHSQTTPEVQTKTTFLGLDLRPLKP